MSEFPITIFNYFLVTGWDYFTDLRNDLNWERRQDAPRYEYWTNDFNLPYTYGRGRGIRTYHSQNSHPRIEQIKSYLKKELGIRFEGCFLNRYDDGRDHLGWHSDDDPGIDHNRPIAVVSLYPLPISNNYRKLQVKDKSTGEIGDFELANGSLLLMHAGMQQTHLHRIPKSGNIVRPRISLTFRGLLHEEARVL